VVGHQYFGGLAVFTFTSPLRWRQHGPLKHWYLSHHYTASKHRRLKRESSSLWKSQLLHAF